MILHDLERDLGGLGQLLPADRLLKPAALRLLTFPGIRQWPGQGWAVTIEARDEAEARKVGERIRKELVSKRELTASDPYLHDLPLHVLFGEQRIQVGLAPKAPKPKTVSKGDLKAAIISTGEAFFGTGAVRITGKDGDYRLAITPKKREHKIFRTTVVAEATLPELEQKLALAISKVQEHLGA